MSNASLFRRAEYVETLMMQHVMPRTAAADVTRAKVERRPAPLTFTIADAAKTK